MRKQKYWSRLLFCVLVVASFARFTPVAAADTIWIEAENSSSSNFKFETTSMGREALLSGGEWIMKGVGSKEVAATIPEEGVILKYQVRAEKAGNYTFWMRVGWWQSRANLQWRLGDGEWQDFNHNALTVNPMELGFFTEVSWGNLGEVSLPKGNTTLEIKWPKVTNVKSRMLMAMDCFAFVQGQFTPEGALKQGEKYTDELTKAAAKKVFKLEAPTGVERTEVELSGIWQVARYDDPDMNKDTYIPVKVLPTPAQYDLKWMGFEVPGNPWKVEQLVFGHRLLYRTRIDVPANTKGHGFKLHFAGTHWIVSVFINGQLAGTHKGVWVPWDLDVSSFVKPGQVNEITVAVKGTYYSREPPKGASVNSSRNLPYSRIGMGRWFTTIYPSTKGDGDGRIYGIVNPVTLICTGSAYTEDVFIKPSVARKELVTDVTVRNTGKKAGKFEVVCEAVNDKNGEVEKTFGPVSVDIPAKATQVVVLKGTWSNPKLWWPQPDAQVYKLRTTISSNGKAIDVQEELFGFREVTIEGTGVCINGVRRNFWNWVNVSSAVSTPAEWIEKWRAEKNRFTRFSSNRRISKLIPSREDRLEFFDREGVAGRLCTMIDGMFITQNLMMKNPDGNEPKLVINKLLWENYREHMAQVAKAYRNHPSVIEYQVENELVYITGMNANSQWLDEIEQAMSDVCDAGREYDSTRPYTVGGAGDLSGRLEINEPHYPTAAEDFYPQNAYDTQRYAKKINRWPWDRKKPWQIGEDSFAAHQKHAALVRGSEVYRSSRHAREGKAHYLRMLYSGYRWQGVNAFFPWDNLSDFDDSAKVFSDLAVLARKQSHRLYGGKSNELLFKVMNDTFLKDPIKFKWSYELDGKQVSGKEVSLTIEPGFGLEQTIKIDAPKVKVRQDGVLHFTLTQNGVVGYEDALNIPVLPSISKIKLKQPLLVLDRQGELTKYLTGKCRFESIDNLDVLNQKTGLLLIGHNTLTPSEAFGRDLLKFAANGNGVICFEQEYPPAGAALPTPVKTTTRIAGYVHPQALGTPLFNDLGKEDLIDWHGNHPTATNLYNKPTSGARVLAEAGSSLDLTPLLEMPCGKGVILLCQLRVAEKLGVDPAADILLRNAIAVYGDYVPTTGKVALLADSNQLFKDSVNETGVLVEKPVSLSAALDIKAFKVVALDSTSKALATLVAQKERVEAFTKQGGWILLNGLTLDGMADFNRLVGGDYILRPFRVERLTLDRPDHPLAATLGTRDLALSSLDRVQHSVMWNSPHTYSSVIDVVADFATFTLPPGAPDDPFVYNPTHNDHDPYNYINGMSGSDNWRYTRQVWISETNSAPDLTFRLLAPDTLSSIEIGGLSTYGAITEAMIIVDGNEETAQLITLPAITRITRVDLPKTVSVEKTITIRPTKWFLRGKIRGGKEIRLVGINNISFLRSEAKGPGIALDNIGGLVVFPQGKGGIVLCQIKFMKEEPKQANAVIKARLLSTLLQNMGAGFRSSQAVAVPGVNVRFNLINLQEYGTAYMDAKRGSPVWLGSAKNDISQLPVGDHDFNDVTYHISDYATAPTPDAIVLGAQGLTKKSWTPGVLRKLPSEVKGIKVGKKSDLLYFLHAASVQRPVTNRERSLIGHRKKPFVIPELFAYVLHYADGSTKRIPVMMEHGVANWMQDDEMTRLDGAQIGWSRTLSDADGKRAVIYSMQVLNPQPDIKIETIDIIRSSGRAVPAVLGITLGDIVK